MGKNDTLLVVGAIIAAVFLLNNNAPATGGTGGGAIDLCKLVDSDAAFTQQRMFLAGTVPPGDNLRVIKENGGTLKDLGNLSGRAGTTSTSPQGVYRLYFGYTDPTAHTYTSYTNPKKYTAPCADATDQVMGIICTIDTAPTITAFDEYGSPQTSTNPNAVVIAGDGVADVSVRVKVHSDTCYGNPDGSGKNAICFVYNSSFFKKVEAETPAITPPYAVANTTICDQLVSCYELNLLNDQEFQDIKVTITATSSDPTEANNITIILDDYDMDLDADTLEEVWGFQDEDNNQNGIPALIVDQTTTTAKITIS